MDFSANKLLAALSNGELETLRPHVSLVTLQTKEVLHAVGHPLRTIHFPVNTAVSLMDVQPQGRTVEVAVVGREGCTSSWVMDGLTVSPCREIVQIGGLAMRINIADVKSISAHVPLFAQMVRRFGVVVLSHAVISVGCSQFHSVEQRLARWLLAHWNRTGLTEFPFTHEFLAEQLGVQRVTVTEALGAFQERGLLTYRYGSVSALDLPALERAACRCFGSATAAIDQYLKDLKEYTNQ